MLQHLHFSMIKWCYLGIISFNDPNRSRKIPFFCLGFVCLEARLKKREKISWLGSEFAKVFFGKMKLKKITPKPWINQNASVDLTGMVCVQIKLSSFFSLEWHFEWTSCKILFASCWNGRTCHFQKYFLYSSFSQEFSWIQPEFSFCLVKLTACGKKTSPRSFLLALNWLLNFLPVISIRYSPSSTNFIFFFFPEEEHFSFVPWWFKNSCRLLFVTVQILC